MNEFSWIDAKVNPPPEKYGWSGDVLVSTMHSQLIGRTKNGKWIDMNNEPIDQVILWGVIPKIPEELHVLFNEEK